jgi:hypothetical protein
VQEHLAEDVLGIVDPLRAQIPEDSRRERAVDLRGARIVFGHASRMSTTSRHGGVRIDQARCASGT